MPESTLDPQVTIVEAKQMPSVTNAALTERDGELLVVETSDYISGLQVRLYLDEHGVLYSGAIVVVETVEFDASGRVKMESIEDALREEVYHFQEPQPGLESTFAGIWADVLNVKRVGSDDDFIELGGDSFSAVVIAGLILETAAISIDAADLYSAGTIVRLAAQYGDSTSVTP